MTSQLAQVINISGVPVKGPLKDLNGNSIDKISDVINIILSFLYPLAGIILFLFLVSAGFSLMTSQGNPEAVKAAKAKISASLIGFLLLVLSYFIVRIISYIFGIGAGIL